MILGFQAFSQVWVLMLGKLCGQVGAIVSCDVCIIFGGLDGFWIVVLGLDLCSIVSMVGYSDFCNILVAMGALLMAGGLGSFLFCFIALSYRI